MLKIFKSQTLFCISADYEMITEGNNDEIKFSIPYHFENLAQLPMVTVPGRIKRLAMEVASLASSLPLSQESAIFVRHDSSRIDVMKVCVSFRFLFLSGKLFLIKFIRKIIPGAHLRTSWHTLYERII